MPQKDKYKYKHIQFESNLWIDIVTICQRRLARIPSQKGIGNWIILSEIIIKSSVINTKHAVCHWIESRSFGWITLVRIVIVGTFISKNGGTKKNFVSDNEEETDAGPHYFLARILRLIFCSFTNFRPFSDEDPFTSKPNQTKNHFLSIKLPFVWPYQAHTYVQRSLFVEWG